MDTDQLKKLQDIVEWGGGQWVGIQGNEGGWPMDLVLFNSPQTHTTLALPADEFFTVQAVKSKILESNKTFGGNE